MYTRTYFTEDKKIDVPENYDGTAFGENGIGTNVRESEKVESDFSVKECNVSDESVPANAKSRFSSLFDRLPIKSIFQGFPFSVFKGKESESGISFGTEEILICTVALYLFFSKDGDRECAVMLLILLFIH